MANFPYEIHFESTGLQAALGFPSAAHLVRLHLTRVQAASEADRELGGGGMCSSGGGWRPLCTIGQHLCPLPRTCQQCPSPTETSQNMSRHCQIERVGVSGARPPLLSHHCDLGLVPQNESRL